MTLVAEIDEELGINLENRAEIEATTWLLASESYKNIQKTILDVAQDKDITMSPSERMNIRKHLDWAKAATIDHQGDDYSGNMVATVDQGLYGATLETGFAVKFRKNNPKDTLDYSTVVDKALNSGNKGGKGY